MASLARRGGGLLSRGGTKWKLKGVPRNAAQSFFLSPLCALDAAHILPAFVLVSHGMGIVALEGNAGGRAGGPTMRSNRPTVRAGVLRLLLLVDASDSDNLRKGRAQLRVVTFWPSHRLLFLVSLHACVLTLSSC